MAIGLIIIGDEIMSGKRSDQHFPNVVQILKERGLSLDWARYLGDEPERIIAVLRCLLPQATLRICGGRPTTLGARQTEMFRAGANALMTGDYLTTCGNGAAQDLRMIADAGFEVVQP